ncbi:PadR family transcriptional regulator [Serinicoccus sp. LYQ131]|uniref:PadR family transcriptional regulator n=1 Tax=Serinicoccus sp. LYQ131 TaxID=3378797 RepID=UPI0038522967
MADVRAVTQLRRGVLEYCVLALLVDEERYGYDLVVELSAAGLLASEGTIYPLLSRLRKDELVSTIWRESPAGPSRRYYALTDQGRTALADFTRSWSTFKHSVDHILTRKAQK